MKSTLIHLRLGHIASECIATRSLAPAVSTRLGSRDTASAGKIITESSPAHTSAAPVVGRDETGLHADGRSVTIYSANASAMGS